MSKVIDITPPIRDAMPVYPGNPPVSVRRVRDVAEGAHSTLSEVTMGTHTGLHVDAPAHFVEGAALLEEMPLDKLVGPARVLGIDAQGAIGVEHLEPHVIEPGERILLRTSNSGLWNRDEFVSDYVHLSTQAARYLAALELTCLGVDYLSVGGFRSNGTEVHRALLEAGTLLIEGLDLSRAEPGAYQLVCLPLRLAETEAAPARAVLLPIA